MDVDYEAAEVDLVKYWEDLSKVHLWSIETGDIHNLMDMAVETIRKLQSEVIECRHALNHVAEVHDGMCYDCQSLAQGALNGINREMCMELAREFAEESE